MVYIVVTCHLAKILHQSYSLKILKYIHIDFEEGRAEGMDPISLACYENKCRGCSPCVRLQPLQIL